MGRAMIVVGIFLAALSISCGSDTPEDKVKEVREDHCADIESGEDYRECLAELESISKDHPGDAWAQCAVAAVRATRYLNRNSEMLTRHMLSPPGPRTCGLYQWMEDHQPAMLKSMNKCESLGGAPWMTGEEWKEYRSMITSLEPLSAVKNRCVKKGKNR